MSDRTDALSSALREDLSTVLDTYQLDYTFSGKGPAWPDATVKQWQAFALGRSLLKKYNENDRPSESACTAALQKFLSVNQKCDGFVPVPCDTRDEELLNGVKSVIYNFYYLDGETPLISCLSELFSAGRLGSGMNRFARGSDLYTKLWDSPLSATSEGLLSSWQKLCNLDLRWAAAERHRSKEYGGLIVEGNKLSFVNKNVATARCISTEPTVNMWFQLGVEELMRRRLNQLYSINLANQQSINKVLARRGSRTGGFATIDLESASDSVSIGLAKEILPADFWRWIELLRSPNVLLPSGRQHRLEMVSTMGNGYTFPLQTLIFTAAVITAYRHHGIKPVFYGGPMRRNLGVFGDDIIVDTRAFETVTRVLRMMGFTVNSDKTYSSGPFRESCGGDYVNGRHCRGVYIKRLKTKQDYAVAINLLNRWSAATGIFLPRTVQHLDKRWRLYTTPPHDNDDSGVHVPLDQARGVTTVGQGLKRYPSWVPVASFFEVTADGSIVVGSKEEQRTSNPEGLLLSFLHGDIRGYRLSLRQRMVRYRTKHRVTPGWNYLSPQCRALRLDWRRWSSAVYYNFTL
jgi:hypothetical protein